MWRIKGENPFYDIDETVAGVYHPPFDASADCTEYGDGKLSTIQP